MTFPKHGTYDYYREYFSDVISHVGNTDSIEDNRKTINLILTAFKASVKEWLDYHKHSAECYEEFMKALDNID